MPWSSRKIEPLFVSTLTLSLAALGCGFHLVFLDLSKANVSACPDWCIVLCWCVLCIVMGWRQYINITSIWRWQVKTDQHLAICFSWGCKMFQREYLPHIALNEAFNIHSVCVCLRELSIVKSCQSGLRRDIRNHFCPHLHTFIHQQFLLIDPITITNCSHKGQKTFAIIFTFPHKIWLAGAKYVFYLQLQWMATGKAMTGSQRQERKLLIRHKFSLASYKIYGSNNQKIFWNFFIVKEMDIALGGAKIITLRLPGDGTNNFSWNRKIDSLWFSSSLRLKYVMGNVGQWRKTDGQGLKVRDTKKC